MKRILFLLSRFLDGGIDAVLIDYLRNLSVSDDYRVTLAVSIGMGNLEVFRYKVPQNVEIVHLIEDSWLTRWRKQKVIGRLPQWAKICDEVCLNPIRRHIIGRRLRGLSSHYDAVVDFDCCHYSFLQGLSVWKVAWWHFSFEHRMSTDHRRMRRIGRHLSVYDRVVTISQAMLDEGNRLFPDMEGRWRLIYNAKDPQWLWRLAQMCVEDPLISEHYLLAVERLEESQKDLRTLIHAYERLKHHYHIKQKLFLLGQGRDEGRLRCLVVELGLADDVVFLGFHNNPYPWIWHAELIVHSAKMEGLPTAMIESLLLDKFIVSSDCPTGPREILNGGRAGLLVPVGDAEAMAEAIYQLLTDDTLRVQIHSEAKEHRRKFLFESTRGQFEEVITPSKD